MKKIVTIIPIIICSIFLAGCQNTLQEVNQKPSVQATQELEQKTSAQTTQELEQKPSPQEAYSAFIGGDRSLLDSEQSAEWWIPDFSDGGLQYEYTYLDLDGDGGDELLVQTADAPGVYNAVFHFDGEKLICWNSDGADMSSYDYPLRDGTMVRQYEFNGMRSYTLFKYNSDGEKEDIANMFLRDELIPEYSSEKYPYYEVNGEEVDKDVFDKRLNELVSSRLTERSVWTGIN